MSPTHNNGVPIPLSRVTIGTLDDLGYGVNYSAADRYNTFNSSCKCSPNRALASAGAVTATTLHHVVDERYHKRSLQDPDHPDADAIADAKEILRGMINGGGGSFPRGEEDAWISVMTYHEDTDTIHSYLLTADDL
jgi:hypothetical protein